MIDVSVVIPVYNAEKNIQKCLDSLLRQKTSYSYELIVINDGSKDHSLDVINRYSLNFPRLIKVLDQANSGVVNTRHRGLKEARGKYLMFVDNDDYVDEDYIDVFLNAIIKGRFDCVIGGYRRVNEHKTLFTVCPQENEWSKFMIVAPWARVFDRNFLLKNDIKFLDYKIGEDVYFNLVLYSKTDQIKMIPYVGYNWYFNSESVSNTSQKGLNVEIDIIYLLDKIYDVCRCKNVYYNYFYTRYIIWYLLFSGKKSTQEKFMIEYKRLKAWVNEKGVIFKFPIFSKKLKSEIFQYKIAISIFLFFDKMNLMKLFAYIYVRGGK